MNINSEKSSFKVKYFFPFQTHCLLWKPLSSYIGDFFFLNNFAKCINAVHTLTGILAAEQKKKKPLDI